MRHCFLQYFFLSQSLFKTKQNKQKKKGNHCSEVCLHWCANTFFLCTHLCECMKPNIYYIVLEKKTDWNAALERKDGAEASSNFTDVPQLHQQEDETKCILSRSEKRPGHRRYCAVAFRWKQSLIQTAIEKGIPDGTIRSRRLLSESRQSCV